MHLWGEGWKGQLGLGIKDHAYEPKALAGTQAW